MPLNPLFIIIVIKHILLQKLEWPNGGSRNPLYINTARKNSLVNVNGLNKNVLKEFVNLISQKIYKTLKKLTPTVKSTGPKERTLPCKLLFFSFIK